MGESPAHWAFVLAMSPSFDPYHKWLGIPPEECSGGGPNHYRLLGIKLFETDPDVIENAADQRMGHLRSFQAGKNGALSQQLLNEIAAAKVSLLDPALRAAYDAQLGLKLAAAASLKRALPLPEPAAPRAQPAAQGAAGSGLSTWMVATIGAAAGCAVVLVAVMVISGLGGAEAEVAKAPKQAPAATANGRIESPAPVAPAPREPAAHSQVASPPAPAPAPPMPAPPMPASGPTAAPAPAYPPMPPGRLLLIMGIPEEARRSRLECQRLKLEFEETNVFDKERSDYSSIGTIVAGSNAMDYWGQEATRDPAHFDHVERFVAGGGHLLLFGTYNGRNCENLARFGITTRFLHAETFGSAGAATDLLFQGVEDIVPASGLMKSYGSFKCSQPHLVLLKVGNGRRRGDTAIITLQYQKGRVTFTQCEPHGKGDWWLMTVMLSWVSRGSPVP